MRTARPAALVGLLMLGFIACGGSSNAPRPRAVASAPAPAELAEGERLFEASCARCHGPRGTGSEAGPPLVHIIYEPSHHGDIAFQLAAIQGVRAHHWRFGDMPPVAGVSAEDVEKITAYIRWLQREAGIGG